MSSTIHAADHGFVAGDRIQFGNVVPTDTGISEGTVYYVLAAGLDADNFEFSTTDGGTPFTLASDIASGTVSKAAVYTPITDTDDVMAPPTTPSTPTDLTVDSTTVTDADGQALVRLLITFTPPTEDKTRACYVQVTFKDDGDPASPSPVWDNEAVIYTVPAGQGSLAIDGVAGNTVYYVRVWAQDVYGQVSAATPHSSTTSARDTSAPAIPAGLTVVPDRLALFVRWLPATAKDLAFYEVRYAPDDGTGLAPNTAQWITMRVKTTTVYVGGLVADSNADGVAEMRYWVEVRAVDTSGNVDDGTGTALDFLANPETGWCTAVSGDPLLVGGGDISFGAITDDHIVTNGLSASVIKTGDLRINTSAADMIDGIKVYDSGVLVGLWNETGLYVYSSADGRDYVRLYEGGVSVFVDGVETAALTPDGVNAASLTYGTLPGGHNLIANSGFELAAFASTSTTAVTWTVAADWSGTKISETNITEGAGALTMTGSTY